jgi:hypothetical protein
LTGRQVIEILSAGGTVVGATSRFGTSISHLTSANQRKLKRSEIPAVAFPERALHRNRFMGVVIGCVVAVATFGALVVAHFIQQDS